MLSSTEPHIVAFEAKLAEEWAVDRRDVYSEGIGPPVVIRAAQPMRPNRVLSYLQINQSELIDMLASGALPRPGKLGHGRVAWRFDEIDRLNDRLI